MSLELKAITKTFGDLTANDSIDLKVAKGEIHAILGENGAGKSTLMNIVYGLLQADSGSIWVDGNEVKINEPSDALNVGIGMVHQHFMLVPVFTVAENIVLGHETSKRGLLSLTEAKEQINKIATEFKFEINPDDLIENLPVGVQQRVEIIRALMYEAKVLILDEPTAVLTPQETDELLNMMKILKAKGTSIIIIRLGKVVGIASPSTTQEELANLMVGRPVDLTPNRSISNAGANVLSVTNLNIYDFAGRAIIKNLNLDIKAGEILAIAGVQGNGQTELVRAIMNLGENITGSVKLEGVEILGKSVNQTLDSGIAYIPESREVDGLIGSFTIAENLILDTHDTKPFASFGQLSATDIASNATALKKEFDIRAQSIFDTANSLSGGNKQKVVLARELSRTVKLVVAAQPTRGLDVGSIEFVHDRLLAERNAGRAVLLISTELDEVTALADRIAVIYRGEILGVVDSSVTREKLGLMMAGIK
ncbi:MAG: ABC transporter ATP-binding protein [Actinobacteria bacterium]|nr:ABC transporter ATP-binding protein [Actinomycetota bacterium]